MYKFGIRKCVAFPMHTLAVKKYVKEIVCTSHTMSQVDVHF